ncbi:hypothetical protein NM688_g7455 [Phlebia brevispora]|uniref:Uncharacterized protein n=1 Tax=Phlebia brevispora TaxID=194682 RepID=A0ACC1S519_9APHY|nr:hypothetical protein NM688_g7455 [Phlebia brevispora]
MSLRAFLSRSHKNYVLLGHESGRPERRLTLRLAILLLVFAVSLGLNAFFYFRDLWSWPRPLDDYQGLNHSPLLDSLHPASAQRNAIVTTLYSDSYAPAVATLGHSLQRANTTARMLVLYFPERISQAALCLATSSGFTPHPISRIPPPRNGAGMNPHFMDQFTKLTLWTLDTLGIDALVYMDADMLVLRNFDEVFTLPYKFAAVPDVFLDSRGFVPEFNAGFLYLKPSTDVYNAMIEALPTARFPPEYAEQAFLNQFFSLSVVRLPYVYNGNLAYKKRSPKMWEGIHDELRVIHYTIAKPFVGRHFKELKWDDLDKQVVHAAKRDGGVFREEMEKWGQMWDETRIAYDQAHEDCWAE